MNEGVDAGRWSGCCGRRKRCLVLEGCRMWIVGGGRRGLMVAVAVLVELGGLHRLPKEYDFEDRRTGTEVFEMKEVRLRM